MAKKRLTRRRRWRRPQRLTLDGPPVARRKDLVVPDVLPLEPETAWHHNRNRMATLLVGFVVVSGVWGALVGWPFGLVWATAPAAVGLAILYVVVGARYGDGWMRGVLGASASRSADARNVLEGVAERAGVPVPELYLGPGEATNAIALGLRRRWMLLTPGALSLDRLELEALLAHEVAHHRDGDSALASAYILIGGAVELGTKGLRSPRGSLALVALPLWPVCLLVRGGRTLFFSDTREHRADVIGALLTRYPPGMQRLLQRTAIEHGNSRLRGSDPFWFAPRMEVRGPTVPDRALAVAEM